MTIEDAGLLSGTVIVVETGEDLQVPLDFLDSQNKVHVHLLFVYDKCINMLCLFIDIATTR